MVSDWAGYSAVYQKHEPLPTTKVCSLPESAGSQWKLPESPAYPTGYYYSQIKVHLSHAANRSETALLNVAFISK